MGRGEGRHRSRPAPAEIEHLRAQLALSWDEERKILDRLGIDGSAHVLEIGSGPGFVTERLLEWLPGARITAVEIRPEMASEARFAPISRLPGFPISAPVAYFADYQLETGTGLLITERVAFGEGAIEPHRRKCFDHELADPLPYYREAIELASRAGTSFVEGVARVSLVAAQRRSGDIAEAAAGYAALLVWWRRTGHNTQLWTTARNAADGSVRETRHHHFQHVRLIVGCCIGKQDNLAAGLLHGCILGRCFSQPLRLSPEFHPA